MHKELLSTEKGMVVPYWEGVDAMYFCDFPNCNSAISNKVTWVLVLAVTVFEWFDTDII